MIASACKLRKKKKKQSDPNIPHFASAGTALHARAIHIDLLHISTPNCAGVLTDTMDGGTLVAGTFKPLVSMELHGLSQENEISQDAYDMAMLGRAQELNVSTTPHPSTARSHHLRLNLTA
jgi:hypothetical protein